MNIEELSGWLGAVLVLIAYFMVSTGRAKADSTGFQLINILGAAFLIYYTYSCEAYASMIVNIIWVFIGLSSFITYIKLNDFKSQIFNTYRSHAQLTLKTRLFCVLLSSIFILTLSTASIAQIDTLPSTEEVSSESEETIPEDSEDVTEEEVPSSINDEDEEEVI